MSEIEERFIGPDFWYNFESGPGEVRSIEDAKKYGNNCVALAHLVFAHMHGVTLPPELHCYEWYADTELFPTVPLQDIQPGALVWFAPYRPPHATQHFVPQYKNNFLQNYRQGPARHMATYIGSDASGEPQLLHTSRLTGTNAIWLPQQFSEQRRYARISRVGQPDLAKIALQQTMGCVPEHLLSA